MEATNNNNKNSNREREKEEKNCLKPQQHTSGIRVQFTDKR